MSLIGDFRAIGIADIADAAEADAPGRIDALLATAAFFRRRVPGPTPSVLSADSRQAYKIVDTRRDIGGTAAAGAAMVELRTHPFGHMQPPANWAAVGAGGGRFRPVSAVAWFYVTLPQYDVCCASEAEGARLSAVRAASVACALLGFGLEGAAEWPASAIVDMHRLSTRFGIWCVESALQR